jgi:hypothetical protein
MPIKKGRSQRVISENIKELISSKPSKKRGKGIATIAKKRGISKKKAKELQAKAIAYASAKRNRRGNII